MRNEDSQTLVELLNWFKSSSVLNPIESKYTFLEVNKSGKVESQCNAISFLNQGDEDILIEGVFLLAVGDAMLTMGNGHADYDTTEYNVRFAGGGTNPKLVVIKRLITGKNSFYNVFTLGRKGT